jgi:hypothetical protein
VCELNGEVSFSFFNFILFFSLNKVLFCCLFYILVTKTKIRNRKAVFQADSPIKGSETLHGRIGVIVSVRSSESL